MAVVAKERQQQGDECATSVSQAGPRDYDADAPQKTTTPAMRIGDEDPRALLMRKDRRLAE